MSTYLPTLKQLQYLVALHEHGHFGRAADACFVTQSTLSAGLRELESLLGVMLVERTRGWCASPRWATRWSPRRTACCARPRNWPISCSRSGQPLVGRDADERDPDDRAVPAAAHPAPPAPRAPDLKLFLREEPSAAAIESLHHGRADCVLLALPYATGEVETRNRSTGPALRRLPEGRSARSARRSSALD